LVAAGALDADWVDLRLALPRARQSETRYELYIDNAVETDRRHAERLAGLDGVRLYRFGKGGHAVARSMRETGALQKVLERALGGPGAGA